MFKFLLILAIVVWALYKVGTFFFKAGAISQQMRNQGQRKRTRGKDGKIKGGDYVDYEEV